MDYKFEFAGLDHAKAHHSARLCILYPLLGSIDPSDEGQKDGLAKVLHLWRFRAANLLKAGWKGIKSTEEAPNLGLQYARNCWPSAGWIVKVDQSKTYGGRVCQRCLVCPWCYARRVAHIYDACNAAVTIEDRLVTVCQCERLPNAECQDLPARLIAHIEEFQAVMRANAINCRGGWYAVTISPHTTDGVISWDFTRRALLLLNRKKRLLLCQPGEEWDRPRSDDIVTAVTRVLRYPVGMLREPPELVVRALDACSCLTTTNLLGNFRSKANTKQEVVDGNT